MIVHSPDWWQFLLVALAAFRVYRLIAKDTITEPVRAAVTMPDDVAVTLGKPPSTLDPAGRRGYVFSKSLRVYAATLIRCPWCAGFYVSVAWWVAWDIEPRWTTFLAVPWALSAAVALAEKNLDR